MSEDNRWETLDGTPEVSWLIDGTDQEMIENVENGQRQDKLGTS